MSESKGGAGEKRLEAINGRLLALNINIKNVKRLPHDAEAMAIALAGLKTDLL